MPLHIREPLFTWLVSGAALFIILALWAVPRTLGWLKKNFCPQCQRLTRRNSDRRPVEYREGANGGTYRYEITVWCDRCGAVIKEYSDVAPACPPHLAEDFYFKTRLVPSVSNSIVPRPARPPAVSVPTTCAPTCFKTLKASGDGWP